MPEPWEEPVGKTEPIKSKALSPFNPSNHSQLDKIKWAELGEHLAPSCGDWSEWEKKNTIPVPQPKEDRPFLDTLVFRDDLSKYQIRMAGRAIENLKGMMSAGWIVEEE